MFAQLFLEVRSAMEKRPNNLRRRAAAVLLLSLAAIVGHGQAGMLPMADSVAEFTFADGELDYWPTVDGSELYLTSDNAVMLTLDYSQN
jgi:ferric-dicitrate binding protein FerR (iron transport regulator)